LHDSNKGIKEQKEINGAPTKCEGKGGA